MGSPTGASSAQQSIWLASAIASHPSTYNLLWALRFKGEIEDDRIETALLEILRRHDALRATFWWNETYLEQMILPLYELKLGREIGGSTEGPASDAKAIEFAEVPFDLSNGPLFRFKLVKHAANERQLLCCFHHLVIDGTSWPLFVGELLGLMRGETPPDLEYRYLDYRDWQAAQLQSGRWNDARAYWSKLAVGIPQPWEAPLDRIPRGLPGESGGHLVLTFRDDLAQRLREVAACWNTSPFRVAFAAFVTFLSMLTRRDDVVVATTFVGRSEAAFRPIIGMFVNSGIIHAKFDAAVTFRDLAMQIHSQIDEGVKHQDYPFHLALQEAASPHRTSPSPFTNVSFVKLPRGELRRVDGLEVTDRRIFLPYQDRALSVYLQDDGGQFSLNWNFREALFRSDTITRFAAQFQGLLAEALARPETPVDELAICSAQDRQQMLRAWNDTDCRFSGMKALPLLFEDQVERTPDRLAVISSERRWTYREINSAANCLAQMLRTRGIGRGSFVPLLMQVAVDLLVAELAVMKCGAAFVPLGLEWPKNRLHALFSRLGSRIVIIQDGSASNLVAPDYEIIDMQRIDFSGDPGNEIVPIDLDDPIYCIFTSGSTGSPKGAVNRHLGIVNRLFSMNAVFGKAADEVILATAPATVDTLVWQFFWPLICGGQVVVAAPEHVVDPEHFIGLVKEHRITITDLVPSIFQTVVNYLNKHPDERHGIGNLRSLILGGEAMNANAVYEFKTMIPGTAIFNAYGPTETSIGAIFHEVRENCTNPIPIGRPFPNIRAVILDKFQRPTPIGMVGELCLGGACVGLGYLNDPVSTGEKFIPNSFPEMGCDLLYRTGDLARFRSDGLIEFLGRTDNQIKIRGVRIEPGEIEATLTSHPAIEQAIVSSIGDGRADAHLVAHIVARPHRGEPNVTDLRDFLLGELPAHMIPSRFVLVPHLPLTPGGKVDRKAVKGLGGVPLVSERRFQSPGTELERIIFDVWQEILEEDRFSIHDNFFLDLNGDSLKALLFVLRFEERTGRKANLSHIYEAQTVAALARRIAQDSAETPEIASNTDKTSHDELGSAILARQRHYIASWKGAKLSADSFLFMTNPGGRRHPLFWCLQGFQELERLSRRLGSDQPLAGMRSGHLIMDYTEQNLDVLASQYAAEMAMLQPRGPFVVGGNCQGAIIAHRTAQILLKTDREVTLLILMEDSAFRYYEGRVALMFGQDSHLNPYATCSDPDPLFKQRYPAGYTVDQIPGKHGAFFDDQNIAGLANALASRINNTVTRETPWLAASLADLDLPHL